MNQLLVIDESHCLPPAMEASILAQRDNMVGMLSNFLGPNEGGFDSAVPNEFGGERAQERFALITRLSQMFDSVSMSLTSATRCQRAGGAPEGNVRDERTMASIVVIGRAMGGATTGARTHTAGEKAAGRSPWKSEAVFPRNGAPPTKAMAVFASPRRIPRRNLLVWGWAAPLDRSPARTARPSFRLGVHSAR